MTLFLYIVLRMSHNLFYNITNAVLHFFVCYNHAVGYLEHKYHQINYQVSYCTVSQT